MGDASSPLSREQRSNMRAALGLDLLRAQNAHSPTPGGGTLGRESVAEKSGIDVARDSL